MYAVTHPLSDVVQIYSGSPPPQGRRLTPADAAHTAKCEASYDAARRTYETACYAAHTAMRAAHDVIPW